MKAKRNGLLLSCVLATSLAASCYGPFNATRGLYKWNGEVSESKWAVEGVFLGLAIIPVYAVFMLGDAIIFNSIEFWGGENPVDPPTAAADVREFEQDGRTIRLEREDLADGREMKIQVFEGDALVEEYTLSQSTHGPTLLRDGSGAVLGSADTLATGEVLVADASGREVGRF